MKHRSVCLALTILPAVMLLSPAALQGQSESGARTHDGFFMRFLAGVGPGSVTLDDFLGSELVLSLPTASAFHLQIGGVVGNNLALFGDLGGFAMSDPDVEWAGSSASTGNTEVVVSGIGLGATYYWMPANVYISASALTSRSSLTFQGSEASTELGGSAFVAVGKEWWVGDKWGLGVAIFADFGTMKDQSDGTADAATLTTGAVGIAFSATLN